MEESTQPLSRGDLSRREVMQTPDDVAAMLRLKGLGWGVRRIAKELGCSHMTVRHYVAQGGWRPFRGGGRRRALAGLEDWVAECFRRHAGKHHASFRTATFDRNGEKGPVPDVD